SCCEWAVHRGNAEVTRLPIAGGDPAGRVTGATLAICGRYSEGSNPEPGSRSVHHSPSRLRPLNVEIEGVAELGRLLPTNIFPGMSPSGLGRVKTSALVASVE